MKKSNRKYKILIAPLDWGLGHATRCSVLINFLIKQNVEPVIAAYGSGYQLLKSMYPGLTFIKFPGLKITYPSNYSLTLKMILSIPVMIYEIFKEHQRLKQVIADYDIDAVISDSRFGLFNHNVPAVFMSHQVRIKLPTLIKFLEYPFFQMTKMFINKFNYCWVPDLPGEVNLSGELSHGSLPRNCRYIGTLSRFKFNTNQLNDSRIDLLIIISGIENQRTMFEEIIFRQVCKVEDRRIVIVQGKVDESKEFNLTDNIKVYSNPKASELNDMIKNAKVVVCRAGYSTLMELAAIGKKAILIPTPGQTEQEYLAKYMQSNKYAPYFLQSEFDLNKALVEVKKYSGIPKLNNDNLLQNAVYELLDCIN